MAPSIGIRAATLKDREWAATLMTHSEPWMTLGRTLEASLASVADAEYQVFIAHENDHPLGFLILDPRGVAGAPYIKSIGVEEDVRSRGTGSLLMAHAETICRQIGAGDVFLCVSSFNPRARALYERLGYELIGELANFVIVGASELLMRKRLSSDVSEPSADAMQVENVEIRRDSLASPAAVQLITALNAELTAMFPEPGATHFSLSSSQVAEGDGAFLIAYVNGTAVGCGAIRRVDGGTAELKRMFVMPSLRGQGVGRALVAALEQEARRLGVSRVVLETGTRLDRAVALYEGMGYSRIPLFGEYVASPDTSLCFGKAL